MGMLHHTPRRSVILMVLWLGAGCSYETIDASDDTDTIATVRLPDFEFGQFETYFMDEEVVQLSDGVDDPIELSAGLDQVILDTIAEEMASLGYRRVSDPSSADALVTPGAVATENWALYGWYPYPGYCTYYWCNWWYYYPPVIYPVSYETGSVVIAVTDLNGEAIEPPGLLDGGARSNVPEVKPVVWVAGMRGLINSRDESSRAKKAIRQAFDQSDYLRVGEARESQAGLAPDAPSDADGGVP